MNPKTDTPLFTVIIPTFNRKDFLKIAVNSVFDQTFDDFEIIIIDDGSTDDTKQMLYEYSDKRIKYFYQENKGVSFARNKGLEQSNGKYIAFLDSDDRWVANKLEKTFEFINNFPEIKIFHTEEVWYRRGRLLNQKKKHKKPDGYVYFNALPICCIGMSTSVVNRDVFDDIGIFDQSLPACEDYDFWLRATSRYEVKLIPQSLTIKDGGRADQLSLQPGLDKYRIAALDKILRSGTLNDEQYEKTREELIKKCIIYLNGAKKRGKLDEVKHYQSIYAKYSS